MKLEVQFTLRRPQHLLHVPFVSRCQLSEFALSFEPYAFQDVVLI